jgi:hypothetical protein
MAEVWMTDEDAAKLPGVRAAIRTNTERIGARAEAILATHRDEGDAEIKTEYGSLDGFVVLDDSSGEGAAAAIEFGGVRDDGRPFPGLYILRRAAR